MIPVDQTLLKERGEPGDCFRACVASILELPIEQVPHFTLEAYRMAGADVSYPPFDYTAMEPFDSAATQHERDITNEFLRRHGKQITWPATYDEIKPEGYAIGSGPSPRGVNHAVILDLSTLRCVGDRYVCEVAHDPHPSRSGLVELQSIDLIEDLAA